MERYLLKRRMRVLDQLWWERIAYHASVVGFMNNSCTGVCCSRGCYGYRWWIARLLPSFMLFFLFLFFIF